MKPLQWIANLLGWPLIQLAASFIMLQLPAERFARETWLTAPRHWESNGRIYRKFLRIQKWKSMLPDGARWLGGFAKGSFKQLDAAYIERFLLETRRAEWTHWCVLCCFPAFLPWNPTWARMVMVAYALAANLPCILAQRYNRIALGRIALLQRRAPVGR